MTNFLDNGTVMPHGLLACNASDFYRGITKTYSNTALRFGVVTGIYPIGDLNNISKLTTEYDVDVIEQDMNRGIAPVTYKNCLCVDAMGSIPDFFEKNLRVQTQSDNISLPLTKGQNGATVLVLCLDSTMGKGVVLGALNHPDRPTTLIDSQPRLQGEYNGVNVAVNPDGSTALTFNGATNNDGDVINPNGTTVAQIATDGSFSIAHSGATFTMAKSGVVTITSTGNTVINVSGECDITSTGKTVITASEIDLNGTTGNVLTTATDPVVDYITGQPTVGSSTVKAGS